jgi:hypothetical protein
VKHFNLTSIRRHHLEVFSNCFKCYCYVTLALNSFICSTILNSDLQNYDYLLGRMGVKCQLRQYLRRRWDGMRLTFILVY